MRPNTQISLSEAAHRAGLSWAQMWRLVLCRRVIGRKVGRYWLVDERDVERLVASQGTQTAA